MSECASLTSIPNASVTHAASCILAELVSSDRRVEVGYRGALRVAPQAAVALTDTDLSCGPVLGPESVVLVTGGARGITSQIVRDLALRYRPRLCLVGRSSRPAPFEDARTRGVHWPADSEGRPCLPTV